MSDRVYEYVKQVPQKVWLTVEGITTLQHSSPVYLIKSGIITLTSPTNEITRCLVPNKFINHQAEDR